MKNTKTKQNNEKKLAIKEYIMDETGIKKYKRETDVFCYTTQHVNVFLCV